MGNSHVRYNLLGLRIQYLEEPLKVNSLRWLEHISRMPVQRLPYCCPRQVLVVAWIQVVSR